MRNSRIAIVQPYLSRKGGAANVVIWLAGGLRERGHEVTVFTLEYDPKLWPASFQDLDVRILRTDYPGSSLVKAKYLKRRFCSRQLEDQAKDFDLVNVHNQPAHLWAAWAKKRCNAFPPVVWYCQEPKRNLYWQSTDRNLLKLEAGADAPYNRHLLARLEKYRERDVKKKKRIRKDKQQDADAMRCIDLILTNSRFTAESVRMAHGVDPEVCYLGIPMEDAEEVSAEKGDYILVVSPLQADKNTHNAIEAFHHLIRDDAFTSLKMKIIGFGDCEAELKALASERGLDASVEFLGFVRDEDLARYYREALATVYLPLNEPFGLVSVESQCRGTPAVVSNCNGLCETIRENETGILVDCLDPPAIVARLKDFLSDRERLAAISKEAQTWSRSFFTMDSFLDRFEEAVAPLIQ